MPADIGTLLVRISADISELKQGVAAAKSEIKSLKEGVNSAGSGFSGIGATVQQFASDLKGATNSIFNMFGATMSVYGAFVLLRSATEQWYNLIKSGVDQIDEYRRSVYSAAGLMTSISEVGTQLTPDFQTAYNQWKDYFDWLYRQALEASRKVSSSGKEIFQAGIEMAMRGAVPKTADQVYIVGQLTDFIKSVTRGLSEQQQMFQEIRSLFEGQMRLGAQALQKFTQIDPDFANKFDEARKKAMAMKDATPIFELLRETMMGIRYASADLATTFGALYNTGKTVFQLLMMEAFNPAYDSIVKMAWSIVDLIYQHGKLTQTGQELAAGLGQAWEIVRKKVEEYVNYIINNGPQVAQTIKEAATALGHVADMALSAAGAVMKLVNAIGSLNMNDLYLIIGAAAAAGFLGSPLGTVGVVAGVVAGGGAMALYRASVRTNEANAVTLKNAAEYVGKPELAKTITEAEPSLGGIGYSDEKKAELATTKTKAQIALSNAVQDKLADRATEFANKIGPINKEIDAVKNQKGALGPGGSVEKLKNQLVDMRNGLSDLDKIAFDKGQQLTQGGVGDKAPPTPWAKIQPPKDKKTGAGGRTERDIEIEIQLAKAQRQLGILDAENEYKILKATDEKIKSEIKLKYAEGEMSAAKYYQTLRELAENESDAEVKVLLRKNEDIKRTTQEIIALQQKKADRGNITQLEADGLKEIELVKEKIELKKVEAEIELAKLKRQKEIVDLNKQEVNNLKAQEKFYADIAAKTARGPISKEKAEMAKYREDTELKARNLGITPEQDPEGWSRVQKAISLRNTQIQYGHAIDTMIDAIQTGVEGLIEAVMDGGADLKANMLKAANTMFKGLFKGGFEQTFKQFKEDLVKLFDNMFEGMGGQIAGAMMGVIGMIGMMLTSSSKKSSFSPSGVTSQVTGHEAVRGVIAGETSIPIAQIGVSLQDAMVGTNSILTQIEQNTRSLGQLQLNLQIDIPGIKDAVAKAMENYFASMAQKL